MMSLPVTIFMAIMALNTLNTYWWVYLLIVCVPLLSLSCAYSIQELSIYIHLGDGRHQIIIVGRMTKGSMRTLSYIISSTSDRTPGPVFPGDSFLSICSGSSQHSSEMHALLLAITTGTHLLLEIQGFDAWVPPQTYWRRAPKSKDSISLVFLSI